jgi:hypothetical protein
VRVLICGSRETADGHAACRAIAERLGKLPSDSVIIHGGAHGVDTWADALAWDRKMHIEVWKPDWKQFGKRAGIIRNIAMLDTGPDLVIAFYNGGSSGTAHTVREARKRGITTEVIPIAPPKL